MEEKAKAFWHDVARGGRDYEEGHPTTILDLWLKDAHTRERGEKKPAEAEYYQASVYCWNAFVEERDIIKVRSKADKGLLDIVE